MEAINVSHCEYQASLAILIAYTPYATEEALKARLLELFPARGEQNPALRLPGTHIELYNLSKDLDMDSNPQDIEQHYARHTRESYSQLK